ncbi:hypothetical protein P43SY_000699 [Pythium insidiosum]|uniref:Uncharacterized protein n=1 Tax=Pythium insidiosum TaxID=114742 RepID=A0AAD5QAH8_PYTIN|nr:hypothetical protein P43SY_000699 [Pythium insidiosum]
MEHQKCSFLVQIDASLAPDALQTPHFRFRFFDGSKRATPPVGAPGWTLAEDATHCRFECSIADVAMTEAMARALDDDPIVCFVLSDQPTAAMAASASESAKGAKGDAKAAAAKRPPSAASHESATPQATGTPRSSPSKGRLIADVFEMDLSVLLSGQQRVEQTWTSGQEAGSTVPDDALSIFEELRLGAKSSDTRHGAGLSLFSAHSGINHLTIRITADQALLSPALARKLNPLTFTLASLRRLPPFHAAVGSVRPVYAQVRVLPELRVTEPSSSPVRLVVTSGRQHENTVMWSHSVTFLAARWDAAELHEALLTSSMRVEVHDRDPVEPRALQRLHLKWESLHSTGVDPTAPPGVRPGTPGSSSTTNASSAQSRTTTPRTAAANAATKPMDVFAVDEIVKRDWLALLQRAGDRAAFGEATFHLAELLLPVVQTAKDTRSPHVQLKLTVDVTARKRRETPLGCAALNAASDPATWAESTPLERLVREPAPFLAHQTTLSLHIALTFPLVAASVSASSSLASTLPPVAAPFSRLALLFPYNDSATLRRVMTPFERCNTTALPGVPIRSYELTDAERQASERGQLDLLTGVMVIDTTHRMVLVEGLADGAMRTLHAALLPRDKPNDPRGVQLLADLSLRFTRRLYTAFGMDLKRIKLRDSLPELLQRPDMYLRSKVSESCYLALTRLAEIRRSARLVEVRDAELFPSASMLLDVESKYGESISLEDIYGQKERASDSNGGASPSAAPDDPAVADEHEARPSRRRSGPSLKAPTDASNPAFDEWRRQRTETNYVEQRRQQALAQQEAYQVRRDIERQQQKAADSGPVYMYSGQRLRTQEVLQDELRRRLASDHNATYTFGPEFQSLAFPLVNPDELRQLEEREARKKWTTTRGFVYPAPRPVDEYNRHADAPSEVRREELREPFVDNVNHPKPLSRGEGDESASGRAAFTTLPSKDMIFGGTNADGSVNAEYFRSVHLCGDGLQREMQEARAREQAEWERRLVVDRSQLKFLAHGNICSLPRAQPSQLDKLRDILDGPVRSKPLRVVRHATLPSGKRVPLRAAPASILHHQPYVGPVAATFATTLRTSSTEDASHAANHGSDFRFPSVTDLLTPPVKQHTTYRPIAPVAGPEKRGLLWRNDPSGSH